MGRPSWSFPDLEHDLFVIGCTFAGVILAAAGMGAAAGAWLARRLR